MRWFRVSRYGAELIEESWIWVVVFIVSIVAVYFTQAPHRTP